MKTLIKEKKIYFLLIIAVLAVLVILFVLKPLIFKREPEYFLETTIDEQTRGELYERIAKNNEILQEFPNDYNAQMDQGNIQSQLGNASKAIEYFKKAWETIPTNATPWLNIGNIYIKLGLYKEAEDAFLKARDIRSNYYLPYFNLAKLYKDYYVEKEDQVRSIYLEGLIKTNNDYELLYFFIQYLLEKEIYSEALEYLKIFVVKVQDQSSQQWALEKINELEEKLSG